MNERTIERERERELGVVLGAAIGDALGNPTEFMSLEQIRRQYGPRGVRGFEKWRTDENGRRFAPFTDDTQMAEVVLRTLLRHQEHDVANNPAATDAFMQDLAVGFVEWSRNPKGGHRAPGNACLAGCHALAGGANWRMAGGAEAGGCGSVMRAYPFGLLLEPGDAASLAALHSRLTHRDPIALAACAAMALGVSTLVRDMAGVPETLTAMVAVAGEYDRRTAAMMQDAITQAACGTSPDVVLQRYQGWAAHDAIAASCYVLARHHRDPIAAVLEAINSPGDSDSLGTMVGALVGAIHGLGAWPYGWVRDVERSDEFLTLLDPVTS